MIFPNGIQVGIKKTVLPTALLISCIGFAGWQGVAIIKADRAQTAASIKAADEAARAASEASRQTKVESDLRFQELTMQLHRLSDDVAGMDKKVDKVGDTLDRLLLSNARIVKE